MANNKPANKYAWLQSDEEVRILAKKKLPKLNDKQAAFVYQYMEQGFTHASEAYKKAYEYKGEWAYKLATELLNRQGPVWQSIQILRARVAVKAELSVAGLVENIRQLADDPTTVPTARVAAYKMLLSRAAPLTPFGQLEEGENDSTGGLVIQVNVKPTASGSTESK